MRVLFYNNEPDFTNRDNIFYDGQRGYCFGASVIWIKQLIAHKNNAMSASTSMIGKHRTSALEQEMNYAQQTYYQIAHSMRANIENFTVICQRLGLRISLYKEYGNISGVFDIPQQQLGHYIILSYTLDKRDGHVIAVSNLGGYMCFFNCSEGIIMSENMGESSQIANLFKETTHFFPKEKFRGHPSIYPYVDNKYIGFTLLIRVNFN